MNCISVGAMFEWVDTLRRWFKVLDFEQRMAVISFVVSRLLHMHTYHPNMRPVISRHLVEHGTCSGMMATATRTPAYGFHINWSPPAVFLYSYDRHHGGHTVSSYSLCDPQRIYEVVSTNAIPGVRFEMVIGDRRVVLTRSNIPPPYPWQQDLAGRMLNVYQRTKRVRILVSGTSGGGKTTQAFIFANILKSTMIDPIVVPGFGVRWFSERHLDTEPSNPYVLIWDEFDILEASESDSSVACDSERRIKGVLDVISYMDNVALIATTEKPTSFFTPSIVRRGRFDLHVTVRGDLLEIVDAPTCDDETVFVDRNTKDRPVQLSPRPM